MSSSSPLTSYTYTQQLQHQTQLHSNTPTNTNNIHASPAYTQDSASMTDDDPDFQRFDRSSSFETSANSSVRGDNDGYVPYSSYKQSQLHPRAPQVNNAMCRESSLPDISNLGFYSGPSSNVNGLNNKSHAKHIRRSLVVSPSLKSITKILNNDGGLTASESMVSISEEDPTLVGSGSSPSPTSTNSSSTSPNSENNHTVKKKRSRHVMRGRVVASEEPTESIGFGNSPSLQALSEILNHKVNKKKSMSEIHSIEEEEEVDEDDDLEDEDTNENDHENVNELHTAATATTITTVTITESQLQKQQQQSQQQHQKSNSTYSTNNNNSKIDTSVAYDSTTNTTTTNNSKRQSVYSTYSSTNASTTSFYTAHSQSIADTASVSASVSLSDNVTFGRNSISGLDDSDMVSLGSTIKSLHDATKDSEGEVEAQFVKMKMNGFVTASSSVTAPNTSNVGSNGTGK
ncbi:unnamed protein product [Ambrosiozyma monospora]|uniref:Unnamed protein product n=1 Tax=Ambrosiozyma monospora TaxID=43982 RepID=A0ACB5T353_AMBMO|nr:unnamed protein product [Ambrosiozyma monospora]